MMLRGAAMDDSLTAAMLAGAAPDRLLGAGRRRHELLEQRERLAGHRGDAAQGVQRAGAVRGDLALQLLARPELVEDLADALDAFRGERRGRLEQARELGPQARRGLLERDDHRQGLLALHEVLHLELPGALGRGPDAEEIVVRL